MPNKLNNGMSVVFQGDAMLSFATHFSEFGKNANPGNGCAGFTALVPFQLVWRQLGFAFFGALTSVGALFIFTDKNLN